MGKAKRPPPRNRHKARPPSAARPTVPPVTRARPEVEPAATVPDRSAEAPDRSAEAPDRPATVPPPVRTACLILLAEAVALAGLSVYLLYRTAFGHPDRVSTALLDAAAALGGAAALAFGARGLYRLRPAARTPMVVIQLLSIPGSYALAFQAGHVGIGGPIFAGALAVLYLLFTPPARAALDRDVSV